MKSGLGWIIIACFPAVLYSCKKEDVVDNNGLTGRWLLVEVYSGYTNGGNFKWNSVPFQNSHSLEFTADGKYIRRENSGVGLPECTGTWQLLPDMTLAVNSSCENATMKISELTNTSLIIDYQVREGVIRYKYAAER